MRGFIFSLPSFSVILPPNRLKSSAWGSYFVFASLGALIACFAVITHPFGVSSVVAIGLGLVVAALAAAITLALLRVPARQLISGATALAGGCILGLLIDAIWTPSQSTPSTAFIRAVVPLTLAAIGLVVGVMKSHAAADLAPNSVAAISKLLDTSVLIDGRITDVVQCGFLEGPLVIPLFVLHELQAVADSTDSARRARGRRGLDVVQQLQSLPALTVEVLAHDYPDIREVDLKLIALAKDKLAKIVTNDFNLNKLAQVQGVDVLNINQLASSLKPIVLPGELMRVFILKEGKEHNQGIAYLDDGTMVVVDNARRLISKNVDVVVTSVLQTTAGKMIFGKYDERAQSDGRPISASAST